MREYSEAMPEVGRPSGALSSRQILEGVAEVPEAFRVLSLDVVVVAAVVLRSRRVLGVRDSRGQLRQGQWVKCLRWQRLVWSQTSQTSHRLA